MEVHVFFLCVLLAIFYSCNCDVASPCPAVRAVEVSTPEGVKCVCKDGFYGEKCLLQFRAASLKASDNDVTDGDSSDAYSETEKCPWYKCPGKLFEFIYKNFKTPCFYTGLITGATIGVLATIIIGFITYMVIRYCIYYRNQMKQKGGQFQSGSLENGQDDAKPCSTIVEIPAGNEILQEKPRSSRSNIKRSQSVVIAIPDSEKVLWQTIPKFPSALW